MIVESHSEQETAHVAEEFTRLLIEKPADKALVIGLEGELGAGKTTFVKACAKALGVTERITSPTFVILKSYKLQVTSYKLLVHIDAYRLNDGIELKKLNIEKLLADQKNILLIEWPERVSEILPPDRITIHIDHIDATTRKITTS